MLELGWLPGSSQARHVFSSSLLPPDTCSFQGLPFALRWKMLTLPSWCAALPLLCYFFSARSVVQPPVNLVSCVLVKEETLACKYSSLRYDYALDHSGSRRLPVIYFGRTELINEARSMRRKTLGNSYAALLKYLI